MIIATNDLVLLLKLETFSISTNKLITKKNPSALNLE